VGLQGESIAVAILILILAAVLGARLTFVVSRWPLYRRDLRRIIGTGEGGAVAYGGLLAVPVSVPLLRLLRIPLTSFWDAGAVGYLAAIVCLRIGCAMNGCCRGRVLRDRGQAFPRRVPTQLLEASLAALLLVAATFAIGKMPFPGA